MPIVLDGTAGISGAPVSGTTGTFSGAVSGTTGAFSGNVTANGLTTELRPLVLMTAKAWNWNGLTTNTFIDFEAIPSWARRLTVMLNGVSTNGTNGIIMQLGTSSGFQTTGYISNTVFIQSASVGTGVGTAGVTLIGGSATYVHSGPVQFVTFGGNTWMASGNLFVDAATDLTEMVTGTVTLSGALDRVRITTVGGVDTFDAGTINVMYE